MAAETKRDTEPAQSDLRRTAARIVLAAIMVVIGVVAYNRFTGGDDGDDSSGGGGGSGLDPGSDELGDVGPSEDVTTTFTDPGAPVAPTCPEFDGSSPRQLQFSGPPPVCIDPALEWRARVWTTRGYFDLDLDTANAPQAVNNFVFLALWHYYDGVAFHRVVPETLIQAGDPIGRGDGCEGAGCGGPGYDFVGELPAGEPPFYPLHSVALGTVGPGGSSQFFVVVGPAGEALPPSYSRLGSVIAGRPVTEAISATGEAADADGVPEELTVIEDVSIWVVDDPAAQNDPDTDLGLNPGD